MPAMPSPLREDSPTQTQLGKGSVAVEPSSSGRPPSNLPDTVDPPNNDGPTMGGKKGNAPEPDVSIADPPLQPNTEKDGPETSIMPDFPDLGSNGFIRPVQDLSILEVGRQTFTALSSGGGFAVAHTTFQANGPAVTVQGVSISLGSSHIVVGSSTLLLPTGSGANGVLTAAGQTFTPLGPGSVLINDYTLSENGPPTTTAGTVLSLASSGLVVDSQTFAFPTPAPNLLLNANRIVTFAGQTFTQFGSATLVSDGMTLVANGPAATISGTVMSLASSKLVIGSQAFAFPTSVPSALHNTVVIDGTTLTPVIFAGKTFMQLGSATLLSDRMTLVADGPAATISGTVMSLASSNWVIGSHTFALPTSAPSALPSGVVIDGTTLTAGGPAVTISGTMLSLAFGSSGLFVAGHGSGTATFSVPVTAGGSISLDAEGRPALDGSNTVGGLGSVIMAGFGPTDKAPNVSATGGEAGTTPANSPNSTTGILSFTGGGSRAFNLHIMVVVGFAVCISLFCF